MSSTGQHRRWFPLAALGISTAFAAIVFWGYSHYRTHHQTIRLKLPDKEAGVHVIYDASLGWRNEPNVRSQSYGRPMTSNRQGLRGRETPFKKPAGKKRILVLGDSFAWGYSVGDDETFSAVLEEQLDSNLWEVINTGVSGWSTDQEYLYLKSEGFRYEPDIVVVAYFYGNDPFGNITSKVYSLHKPVFLNTDLELANLPAPRPGQKAAEIRSQADLLDLTTAILLRMAKDCAAADCSLVIMKFGTYAAPYSPDVKKADQRIQRDLAKHEGLYFLDLDRCFAEEGLTFDQLVGDSEHKHWSAFGHQQTGIILKEFLEYSGLLTTTSTSSPPTSSP